MPNLEGGPDVRPIQAVRVDPVRTCRCVLHRHRRFIQVTAIGRASSPTPFVPTEIAAVMQDQLGRMRTLAKEPGRENVEAVSADLVAMPEVTQPADVLWLHLFYHDLHTKLIQARGATAARFNRAVYERLKPGGATSSSTMLPPQGRARAMPNRCIGLSLHPFVRRWRRPASNWTRKVPCSRTRMIRTR
jgi:hypothetical protein